MVESAILVEILLRGASAGWFVLFACKVLRWRFPFRVQELAALFAIGTAAYVIVSGPVLHGLGPRVTFALGSVSLLNSAFFWWFSIALFDDAFAWRWWHFVPPALLLVVFGPFSEGLLSQNLDNFLHQSLIILMMLHAIWLAILHRDDDLVDKRRLFRLIFAWLVGFTGIVIALGEIYLGNQLAPGWLTLLHASAIFTITSAFLMWLLPSISMFQTSQFRSRSRSSSDGELLMLESRLEQLMNNGFYRTEGLKISELADKMNCPEQKLRHLINAQLGFRNFSAYLNECRISEAKKWLSDPDRSSEQITQIAYGLGYGSLSPFNRAFKAETGLTPKTFRTKALREREA